jgi:hypothetical protein
MIAVSVINIDRIFVIVLIVFAVDVETIVKSLFGNLDNVVVLIATTENTFTKKYSFANVAVSITA